MLNYCKAKWAENENLLRKAIAESDDYDTWKYKDLVEMIVNYIFNSGTLRLNSTASKDWSDDITEIDDGDYQGTLLFLIHRDTYQPDESEYLITYVNYGSCGACDTLQRIQESRWIENDDDERPNERQINDFMQLCRDIVMRFKHPFNAYLIMEEAEVED